MNMGAFPRFCIPSILNTIQVICINKVDRVCVKQVIFFPPSLTQWGQFAGGSHCTDEPAPSPCLVWGVGETRHAHHLSLSVLSGKQVVKGETGTRPPIKEPIVWRQFTASFVF